MKHLLSTPEDLANIYHSYYQLNQSSMISRFKEQDHTHSPLDTFNKAEFYSMIGKGQIEQVNKVLNNNYLYIICNLRHTSIRLHKNRIQTSFETMTLFLIQNGVAEELTNYLRKYFLTALYHAPSEEEANFLHYLAIKEFTTIAHECAKMDNISEEIKQCIWHMFQLNMKKTTLTELALFVGINERQLSQQFLKEIGMSIQSYFHLHRIQFSILFLVFSDLTPTQIAATFYYSDAAYYSKLFKQFTSYSPKEYRKEYLAAKTTLKKETLV